MSLATAERFAASYCASVPDNVTKISFRVALVGASEGTSVELVGTKVG